MAFFKFRRAGDDAAAGVRQPESVEALRRRARHRLVGAVVLVLAGVIGFPLLFDTQPRPVAVDIPIEIPDRNKAKPLAVPRAEPQAPVVAAPATAPPTGPVASGPVESTPAAKAQDKPPAPASAPAPEPVLLPAPAKTESPAKAETRPEPKVVAKAEPATASVKAESKPAGDSGEKARALLEGKPAEESPAAMASEGRFVVQVGAFADAAKAKETRLRVEKAGLKTYTHVAETKEGKRIRVRVGPFPSRAEADKAAEKIKTLDLPAAILTL